MTVKQRLILSAIVLTAVLPNIRTSAFEKQADGIIIQLEKQKPTDPKMLKIQVCTENIFHVIAAPQGSFSTRPSLIVELK
jgi:hypothetical protein